MNLFKKQRGERAKKLIFDRVFEEAVKDCRQGLMEQWSIERNQDKREDFYHQIQALDNIVETLEAYVTDTIMEQVDG